jgi:hypothetical protein
MATYSIEKYYSVLGLGCEATLEEVKRAYRQKAKELHPDKNKNPDAQEQFVLLTEAYACIRDLKSGKSRIQPSEILTAAWQKENLERARQTARKYAEMEFEEFQKTDHYKNSIAALTVLEHVYVISAIAVLLTPLWGFLFYDWFGFWIGLFFTILSAHFWAGIFTHKFRLNFRLFFQSLIMVVKTKTFRYLAVTIINIVLIFRVTLNTQLSFGSFAVILFTLYGITFILSRFRWSGMKEISKTGLYLCFVPGVFNLFFLTNFAFSSNPKREVYSFVHETRWYSRNYFNRRFSTGGYSGKREKIAAIILDKNRYDDFPWFRMFHDFEKMKNKTEITYTFEDGFFGFRVLKHHEFSK